MRTRCIDIASLSHRMRMLGWILVSAMLSACSTTSVHESDASQDVATADAAVAVTVPPEAVARFEKAVALMTTGDDAAAESEFRALADAHPAYPGPLLNIAILQTRAERLTDAEQTLRSAIQRNAANAATYNQLGMVLRRLGRFAEAEAAYGHAIEVDPQYANAYLNLGVLCDLYLQQPQRALEAFERYLQVAAAPDRKVLLWISELKARLGAAERSARAP